MRNLAKLAQERYRAAGEVSKSSAVDIGVAILGFGRGRVRTGRRRRGLAIAGPGHRALVRPTLHPAGRCDELRRAEPWIGQG